MPGIAPVDMAPRVEDILPGTVWSEQSATEGRSGPSSPGPTQSGPGPFVDAIHSGVGAVSSAWTELLLHAQHVGAGRLVYCCVLKRWIDVALATALLVIVAPVLLIIALAIRIDSRGPALFRQTRIGRGGHPFVIYKLRTMAARPQAGLVMLEDNDGQLRHKVKNDPRVTRVGKVLRSTSMDELPQLINVIRGDMSLIGPRPELPEIVQTYEPWQHCRHFVRPGITGWWQIQGRSDRPMHENTELDLVYVENLSFRLDLEIMRRTFRAVAFRRGAF
jgi:lipopolysaccharide/colanic/teichoic acid biosynthesis glycosyltransferase